MKKHERYHALKYTLVVLCFLGAISLLVGCKKTNEDVFWDAVEFTESSNSLALLLSSTIIPPAGDYGLPEMEKVARGEIAGIDKDRFFYMSMYPQNLDPLFNLSAERFLFDYDESGDNSFDIYPAFVSNVSNYNFELEDFYADVINQQRSLAAIQVGNLIRYKSGFLEMYVKLKYRSNFSENHAVAVYVYEKQKVASQSTIADGVVDNYLHKNVFLDFVTSQYGSPISGTFSSGHESRLSFRYDYGEKDVNNLGILTVVYKLDSNNQPTGVHTVYRN